MTPLIELILRAETLRRRVVLRPLCRIYQIAKPDSPNREKDEGEEETEDEADDTANSPDEEYMTGEGAYHELGQKTTKKEPSASEITLAAAKQAVERGATDIEVIVLVYKVARQRGEKRRAEKQAQVRAYEEEHRLTREDSDDQEDRGGTCGRRRPKEP